MPSTTEEARYLAALDAPFDADVMASFTEDDVATFEEHLAQAGDAGIYAGDEDDEGLALYHTLLNIAYAELIQEFELGRAT